MSDSKTAQYRERVQRLQAELRNATKDASTEKCIPMMLIAAACVPIVTFLGLYFLSPSFVQEKEDGKEERSTKKVLMWTTIVSLVAWACMYAWTLCQGYSGSSFCART